MVQGVCVEEGEREGGKKVKEEKGGGREGEWRGGERDPLIIYSFSQDEENKILCAERNPFETLLIASLTPNLFQRTLRYVWVSSLSIPQKIGQ